MSGPVVTAIHDAVCYLPITRVAASLASNLAAAAPIPPAPPLIRATLPATRMVYLDLAGWLWVGIIAGSPDTIGTVR